MSWFAKTRLKGGMPKYSDLTITIEAKLKDITDRINTADYINDIRQQQDDLLYLRSVNPTVRKQKDKFIEYIGKLTT